THANGYRSLGSAKVVAGADINPASVDKFAAEFEVAGKYTDFREMLEKENLDIVSVCTWPGTHAEATIAAAQAGVGAVLCEKPMAVSLGQADAMLEACEKSGTKLAIGHHSRFIASNTEARRLIATGAIGQPTLLHSRSGGGLTNNGTHAIDRMRYWLSDPGTEWVIGQVERKTDRYERAEPIEDLCAGIICFAGGTRGIVESDIPASDAPDVGTLIYGTEGMLKISGNALYIQNAEGAGWRQLNAPLRSESLRPDTNQFVELIGWIEGVSGHRNEAKHGRATVEIMMGLYESVRTKGLVRMPLETKESPLVMMINDGTLPVEKPGKYDIRL
ncbi:Gfo/Idh/MocA family oxidoreductase, partial [Candidatus Poribacteria bacterium]|nr:Gfo/Idh/MocA family oxidoreductase [Candidatus Poribacteria bacterium]